MSLPFESSRRQDSAGHGTSPGSPAIAFSASNLRGTKCQRALQLWMRWNAAYEIATASLYDARRDNRSIEAMMDQMDALRQQAIDLSAEALNVPQAA